MNFSTKTGDFAHSKVKLRALSNPWDINWASSTRWSRNIISQLTNFEEIWSWTNKRFWRFSPTFNQNHFSSKVYKKPQLKREFSIIHKTNICFNFFIGGIKYNLHVFVYISLWSARSSSHRLFFQFSVFQLQIN